MQIGERESSHVSYSVGCGCFYVLQLESSIAYD